MYRHSYGYKDRSGDSVTLSRPTPYGTRFGSGATIGVYLSLPAALPSDLPAQNKRDPARIVRKRVPIRFKGQTFFESKEYTSSKEMEALYEDHIKGRTQPDGAVAAAAAAAAEEVKPGGKVKAVPVDTSRPLPKLIGSQLAFFLDGVCQGVAYEDLYDFIPLALPDDFIAPSQKSSDKLLEVMENFNDDGTLGYYPLVSVFGGGVATLNPGPHFKFPPPLDLTAALAPTTTTSIRTTVPTADVTPATPATWRPLCERYAEYYAEQARLDDMDELAALQMLQVVQRKQEELEAALPQPSTLATGLDFSSTTVPAGSEALYFTGSLVDRDVEMS